MKEQFECEINYYPSEHLNQIYNGFTMLEKAGIVKLKVKYISGQQTKPLLKVLVNNKYHVIYDTLDGFNWINGPIEDNLKYFQNNINADFYFKRSFNQNIINYAPNNCKVYPLGLNYSMKTDGKFAGALKTQLRTYIRNNYFITKIYNRNAFTSKDFECYPIPLRNSKILFMTRLWNPDEVPLDHLKKEREEINRIRIENIRTCREEFGDNFLGGLQHDYFSMKHAKDLLLPSSLTNKESFLKAIKNCNICIATTGLHDSIGWKLGEYVAASRAIVTEPLKYEIPGNFIEGNNYLEFNNNSELINNIKLLYSDKNRLFSLMKENFNYYNNFLKTDVLVLNTLLKIYEFE